VLRVGSGSNEEGERRACLTERNSFRQRECIKSNHSIHSAGLVRLPGIMFPSRSRVGHGSYLSTHLGTSRGSNTNVPGNKVVSLVRADEIYAAKVRNGSKVGSQFERRAGLETSGGGPGNQECQEQPPCRELGRDLLPSSE